MKETLSRKQYHTVDKVLSDSVDRGILEETKKKDVLAYYEPSEGLDFIKVLVTIGAILIGLGILLIIVGNWTAIPPLGQLLILMALLGGSMASSVALKKDKPITAYALLYLSLLIFGASLFLINIGFNFNIESNTLFFIWSLGALVLSSVHKDLLLFIAAHVLALIFVLTSFNDFIFIQLVLLMAAFFGGNYYFNYHKVITFGTLSLLITYIIYTLQYFDVNYTIISLSILVIGLLLTHIKHSLNFNVFRLVGLLTAGISAIVLSFPSNWESLSMINEGQLLSTSFSIVFVVYALYMTSLKLIVPLIIVAAFIVRYYFDTFFDFMPRALFFIVGGIIVLGLGFMIEKARQKGSGFDV